MIGNPFSEQYKKLSNPELLEILDNPEDYQSLAIEAAKFELANRNLLPEQVNEAQIYYKNKPEDTLQKGAKKIISTASPIVTAFFNSFKPIHSEDKSKDLTILILSIICGLISIYVLCLDINWLLGSGENSPDYFNVSDIFALSPLFIILPIATLLFWLRTKIGWILFCISNTYWAFMVVWVTLLNHKLTMDIIIDIIFISFLPVICRLSIRKLYDIDKKTMIITITGTLIILAFFWLEYL